MDDLVPLIMVTLVLAMVFGLVLFVSQVQPAKVLVAAAARNCARAGVETLAAGRGLEQARITAVETALAGTSVNPQGLAVRAYAESTWGRGRVFVCEAGYNVRVSQLPMVGWFYPGDYVPLRSRASIGIEPYKSRWERSAP
jgi:hypothetical protein